MAAKKTKTTPAQQKATKAYTDKMVALGMRRRVIVVPDANWAELQTLAARWRAECRDAIS